VGDPWSDDHKTAQSVSQCEESVSQCEELVDTLYNVAARSCTALCVDGWVPSQ
jgi:hypothetical protein